MVVGYFTIYSHHQSDHVPSGLGRNNSKFWQEQYSRHMASSAHLRFVHLLCELRLRCHLYRGSQFKTAYSYWRMGKFNSLCRRCSDFGAHLFHATFCYSYLLPREDPACWGFLICQDRKSTRLNSSHVKISYAVFCLKKKK